MLTTDGRLVMSPSDLVDLLECEHRSRLTHALATGLAGAPATRSEPDALVVAHGVAHEQATLDRFRALFGDGVVEIDQPAPHAAALAAAAAQTRRALDAGVPVVYQGVFFDGEMYGRADFLISTAVDPDTGATRPHTTGRLAYEPFDTKLARHAKPAAVLQLTAYADALARAGHPRGEAMHLLLGDGSRQSLRVDDFLPLLRHLRTRLAVRLTEPPSLPTRLWDDERPACGMCRFAEHCATGREQARDLSLVAGIRTDQRRKLTLAGLGTIDALAAAGDTARPPAMSVTTFESLRAQARLQVAQDSTRTPQDPTGTVSFEIVGPDTLAALPAPSPGDVFFDMEGDPYALGNTGLEYLFGAVTVDPDTVGEDGLPAEEFTPFWAHGRAAEKAAFEAFVDFAVARLEEHPGARIYHYAPYEVTALKRLAAQHGTREEQVDALLRAGALVDLYAVVRKALRVSQRSYSIKYLEPLYMPQARAGEVKNAASSIEAYEEYLALTAAGQTEQAAKVLADIADYNAYDCVSTHRLYRWLLAVRDQAGIAPVPPHVPSELDAAIDDAADAAKQAAREERADRLAAITDPLMAGLPEDPAAFTDVQAARALLAAAVGYHRRETNPAWWEFFRQAAAPLTDLEADTSCTVPVSIRAEDWQAPTGRARNARRTLHVRCDPDRPHPFTAGDKVRLLYPGGEQGWTRDGQVTGVDGDALTVVEALKGADTAAAGPGRPVAVLPGEPVRPNPKDAAVEDLAREATACLPDLPATAAMDLLARRGPRLVGGAGLPTAADHGGDLVAAVIAAVGRLDSSTLAVQGPPGAGKTYLAGQLITRLVSRGWTVGVTSNSHKAVENVLHAAAKAAAAAGVPLPTAKRPKGKTPDPDATWEQPKDNAALARWRTEHEGGHLVGGTAWTFANTAIRDVPFDVLIVDEAGQFALADALAVATAATNLVLLGDPQQLPQVVQGTHPAGADASALGHLLGEHDVIPAHLGYFLDESRRMHPAVCAPVSALSYAGRLHSHPDAAARGITGYEPGLYLIEASHAGNTTCSLEEADAVVDVVGDLLGRPWHDGKATRPLDGQDVLVVAPYNLQVRTVARRLADTGVTGIRVGTVDRFQGQEAAVVITTMTASSAADLPRGLDFLLSRNRMNVALSRAQALAVLICSPALAHADARSVAQLRLVAGLVGLLAQARPWKPGP